jgi:TPR repeat protein
MAIDADQQSSIELGPDATGAELYQAGLACSTGQGAPLSYIEAHKWFNLAALAGVKEAKVYRRELADLMSSADIAAAQEAARTWMAQAILGRGRSTAAPKTEARPETRRSEVAQPVRPAARFSKVAA